jgi:tetratricopeptide (TPR) repeat protein
MGMFLVQKDSRASIEEAVRLFTAATARDATFAPAHVGLARAYNALATYFIGGLSPADARPKAVAAAREAVRLDPDLADAHTQLAYVEQREWRWSAAEAGYRRAIRLNPSHSQAFGQLADLLVCLGRFDEGLAMARRARDMDPLSLARALNLSMVLYFARHTDESIRELRAVTALHPDDPRLHWYLGNAFMEISRFDEAVEALERSVARERNPGPLGFLTIAYARAGRRHDAERVLEELTRAARDGYVPPAAFVAAYTGLGDVEQAFLALERAYAERSNLMRSLKVLPILDPLRGDPRFGDFLRRVGLD